MARISNAPRCLINYEIQKHDLNETKFNGVYLRKNSPKVKDGAYVINLDEYNLIGTDWITLDVNGNNRRAFYDAIYFGSFGVEYISKGIKKFIGNKNIIANVYRIQVHDLIICGHYLYWIYWFYVER